MPRISVIVPVYGVEPYLDRCVASLLAQTFTDFELILVDDGSPDRCGEMCDRWSERDARVRVFHKTNGGLSDARNFGIERAEGELLTFVDSDDYVKETYLSYLLSLFEHAPDAAFTACNHTVVRENSSENNSDLSGVRVLTQREAFVETLYHGLIDVSVWAKLYKKEVFFTLRFPVGHLYEDTYVFGDILSRSESVAFGGDPQYYYVQRSSSIVNGGFTERRLEYLRSVERLTAAAMAVDPTLETGCLRRTVHAKLSVLRYMDKCEKQHKALRAQLRREVLACRKAVMGDPKAPKRDLMAIKLLRFGFFAFYTAWKIYGRRR